MKITSPINTEIIINATAETVWNLLVDLPGYKKWNPFIQQAEGKIGLGEKLTIKPLVIGEAFPITFTPEVTTYNKSKRSLAWGQDIVHEAIGGGTHSFEIQELPNGQVKLIHDEIYYGVLAHIIRWTAGIKIEQGLIAMNEGLKKAAEAA